MPITPQSRERLYALMEERRLELGLTWREVADRAGLSYEAIRNLRTGPGGMRALSMRRLDAALEWRAGSVQALLAGGDAGPADLLSASERHAASAPAEAYRPPLAGREDNGA